MVGMLAPPTRPDAGPGFQVKVLNGRASAEDPLYTPREVFPTPPRPRSIFTQELNRGTSLIRNTPLLGPYSRTMPRVLWWS